MNWQAENIKRVICGARDADRPIPVASRDALPIMSCNGFILLYPMFADIKKSPANDPASVMYGNRLFSHIGDASNLRSVLYLLCCLFLFSVSVAAHNREIHFPVINWEAENIKRVILVDCDVKSTNTWMWGATDARVEIRDGRKCLIGPYFLFDVDDAFAYDIDEDVTIDITVDRRITDGFIFSYDHAVEIPVIKKCKVPPEGNNPWYTETITLKRARFASRLLSHTDFAIGSLGSERYRSGGFYPDLAIPVSERYSSKDLNPDIAISDIRITRNAPKAPLANDAKFELTILNRDGKPTPARVGLYDASGRMPVPSSDAVPIMDHGYLKREHFFIPGMGRWPGKGRYVFYTDGQYSADLPAGDYQLVISKGFEYFQIDREASLTAGETTQTQIELKRWTDMPAKGWYSCDGHLHFTRTRENNEVLSNVAQAEDIHVSHFLQMTNLNTYYFTQYAFGRAGDYIVGNHVLVSGQEGPRTSELGHTVSLNGLSFHHDKDHYHQYLKAADAIRGEGGLFGFVHVARQSPHADLGLALTVPFGVVEFVEIMQLGFMDMELYYDILNLGYRVTPMAGTDSPYLNLFGADRFYVKLNRAFSPEAWFDAFQQGRSFVTSGPMLELDVSDHGLGSKMRINAGEMLSVKASASVNPTIDKLDRLELVVHGDVVACTASSDGAEQLALDHTLTPDEGRWLAVRAYGKGGSQAHSGAVYVLVDDVNFYGSRDKLADLVNKYKKKLDTIYEIVPIRSFYTERCDFTQEELTERWRKNLEDLKPQIEEARRRYDQLLKQWSR